MVPETWNLPTGWTWHIVRVIHCLPDDQVDGYRVTLSANDVVVIEVIHRSADHARTVALDAAFELYPGSFKGYK
jgi:hypothetical protein